MKRLFSMAIICLFLCQLTHAQTSLQRVATSLSSPLYGTHVPGDTNRMFWLEQGSGGTGRIKVQNLTSGSTSTFMSISGLFTGGEQGLLGLAFDPDYANNGYFYTNVSASVFGAHRTEIRRYSVNPANPNLGDPSSAQTLMSYSQPFANHNGGWIGFNPQVNPGDSQYLYIASGDGGSGGDPGNRAQDITNQRLGKMLRIDVNGDDFPADPNRNYAIPPSNPFVGVTGDDEIWAYGLRNPWRSSFDRQTGDVWIGDVGQDQREEIDFQPHDSPGGENYGWRVMEANRCYDNSQAGGNVPCFDPSLTGPIHEYTHALGNSVTGGYVYRGSIAQYEGLYFFGDFGSRQIWSLDPHAVNPTATVKNRNSELVPNVGFIGGISSFAEDANGEVYLVNYSGSAYRFSSTSARAEWNGNDAGSGAPGDGTSWGQAANWTRGGNVDVAFQNKDELVFVPGSSITALPLGGPRTVGGVRFEADYTLTGDTLTVLSGNVRVSAGITARIDSTLSAETGNASLRKLDAGTLLIGGTSGQVVVMEGALGGTGTVANLIAKNGATVAPGMSVGQLNVDADFTMESGSTLEIELLDTSSYDVLAVTDQASLQGNLALETAPGYVEPDVRGTVDQFTFLTAGEVQGVFDDVTFDGTMLDLDASLKSHAGDGLFRGLVYSDTEVLFFNYFALGGDANGDGTVDGVDFLVWNENKFQSGTDWLTGDFTGDGITDGTDFLLWNKNKFTQVGLPAVPEPSAWLLVLMSAIILRVKRS